MKTLTKQMQSAITPTSALDLLIQGNKRFVNNLKINRNLLEQANDSSDGQHPFAVILSCIDSRTSVELIFDQGLGAVFSIRIAGSVIAVFNEKSVTNNRTASNDDFVEKVAAINVRRTVEAVMERSPILKEMIQSGACAIIGGFHNISTGEVMFYEDTFINYSP